VVSRRGSGSRRSQNMWRNNRGNCLRQLRKHKNTTLYRWSVAPRRFRQT